MKAIMTKLCDYRPEWLKKECANPRCWVYEQDGSRCERGPVVATIPGIGFVCRYHNRKHE